MSDTSLDASPDAAWDYGPHYFKASNTDDDDSA
jgi:hypothetical protein